MIKNSKMLSMSKGEFHERLGDVARGYKSVNGFSKLCGISNSLMLAYLDGGSLPGLGNLLKIAAAAEVSLLWLATGEGPKSNGPVDDHHGPMMEAARERLRIIDEA
ncbi:MAG: hypothetical protein OEV92_08685, partial [Nitrospinota bacterium]|nr:hypothetical protein [Nitrospinota bacterium]